MRPMTPHIKNIRHALDTRRKFTPMWGDTLKNSILGLGEWVEQNPTAAKGLDIDPGLFRGFYERIGLARPPGSQQYDPAKFKVPFADFTTEFDALFQRLDQYANHAG